MSLCAAGAVEIADASPPAAADFSDGLGQLAALARFPLDEKAVWARLPVRGGRDELSKITARTKGNGWSFPAADGGTQTLAMGAPAVADAERTRTTREPSTADLAADVGTIIKNIAAQRPKADDDYDVRWMRDGGEPYGTLLLFAAQIHQAGHPAEANRLAAALFQAAPSRQSVVDSAIESIADDQFRVISEAFFKDYDWTAYHTSLNELYERFPRGWSTRRAVAMFLPQLGRQVAGEPPAAVALAGVAPDPRALEAIAELSKNPGDSTAGQGDDSEAEIARMMAMRGFSYGRSASRGIWILKKPDAEIPPGGGVDRLTALGMDAVTALAALTEDPYLLPIPNGGASYGRSYYFSSRESAADRALRTYRSMQRPATRGEFAIQLLADIIPDPDSDLGQADAATVRELAVAFWKEHKDSTREEIALAFAIGGSSSQRSEAINVVAVSSDPAILEKLEQRILTSPSMFAQVELVQSYVRHRKTAAEAFVTTYVKRLREEIAGMDPDDMPWELRHLQHRGGIEGVVKSLQAQVAGRSPRAIARDIGRGDPDEAVEAMEALRPLLEDLEPRPHLHSLLEGAFAAKDAAVRAMFLTETFRIDWDPDEDADDDEEEESPERSVSEAEDSVWKKLIADRREFPAERWARQDITTVSQLAAFAMENSISPGFAYRVYQAAVISKQTPAEIAMARATARHTGKPVPPLPNAENIDAERLAEIVAEAGAKPPGEIPAYLDGLAPDERAAWLEWIGGTDEPAAPDSVKLAAATVTMRSKNFGWDLADVAGAGGIDLGFTLTRATLAERIADLAKNAAAHSRTTVWISHADFQPGLQAFAARPEMPAESEDDEDDEDDDRFDGFSGRDPTEAASLLSSAIRAMENAPNTADAAVHVGLFTQDIRAEVVWLSQDAVAQPVDPEEAEKLFEAVEATFASGRSIPFRLQIQVITRADAEQLKQD